MRLRRVRVVVSAAGLVAAAGCASGAVPVPEAVPEPEPARVEPPLPTLEERRAAPFAVLSAGRAVPYRLAPTESVSAASQELSPRSGPARSDSARPDPSGAAQPGDPPPSAEAPRHAGAAPPAPPEPASTVRRTHRVGSGDTLWNIARRYGVPMDAIRRANAMDDDVVRIGQLLIIPPGD